MSYADVRTVTYGCTYGRTYGRTYDGNYSIRFAINIASYWSGAETSTLQFCQANKYTTDSFYNEDIFISQTTLRLIGYAQLVRTMTYA